MTLRATNANVKREVPPPTEPILVSEAQAAQMMGVSLATFRNWVAQGRVPRVEPPNGIKRRLYRRTDLEAFAAALANVATR